jgi:serine/threonine protein kinase
VSIAFGEAIDDLWSGVYADTGMVWTELSSPDRIPSPISRTYGLAAALDTSVLVYGGAQVLLRSVRFLNDTWLFDPLQRTWQALNLFSTDPAPPARILGGTASYKNASAGLTVAFLFGGCYSNQTVLISAGGLSSCTALDDVWSITQQGAWKFVYGPGQTPLGPIAGHSVVSIDDLFIIFGGSRSLAGPVLDNLLLFNATAMTWRVFNGTAQSPWPSARLMHGAAAVDLRPSGRSLYMFVVGGTDAQAQLLRDMWMLDVKTLVWQQRSPLPYTIQGFALAAIGQEMILHGGLIWVMNGTTPVTPVRTNGTWSYNAYADAWTVIPATGFTPSVNWHSLVPLGSWLLRFGGVHGLGSIDSLSLILPGCPPGTYAAAFGEAPCAPCAKGTYASTSGSASCTACPEDSWTAAQYSASVGQCSICRPGICNNGQCTLRNYVRVCTCDPWFLTIDDCSQPLVAIISLLAVFVAVAGLVGYCKFRRVRRGLLKREGVLQRLLDENEELARVWDLSSDDVLRIERIDAGTFGEVWRGEYAGAVVAIKYLRLALVEADESFVTEFRNEIDLMRRIRNRNIVLFYGAGALDGQPFLVTEYCARGSLRRVLDSADVAIDWKMQVSFALDAARGMRFLHDLKPPRLHRDLKCQNLLVSDRWVVKVADFGTARVVSMLRGNMNEARENELGVLAASKDAGGDRLARVFTAKVGTLLWQAPEVLRDDTNYGLAVDVYSFGVVMYEIYTRKFPYEDIEDVAEIEKAVLGGARPRFPEECPDEWRALANSCMDASADSRPLFSEIAEVLQCLQEPIGTINDSAIHSRATSSGETTPRPPATTAVALATFSGRPSAPKTAVPRRGYNTLSNVL